MEFPHFVDKVQALLDFCLEDEGRFLSVLTSSSDDLSHLDILEQNEFRNLLHLRLEFRRASSEESASWLAGKLLA